jgi:NAD(P)H-binding
VIVRPSWLTDEPGGQRAIRFEQGDAGEGEIARADVAAVVVAALGSARARGKTFEIYNQPGARRRRSGTPRSPCSPPTEEALDMAMQEATLHSDGLAPAGHLWLPEGKSAEPHLPAIALSGPMTAVKDQVTG